MKRFVLLLMMLMLSVAACGQKQERAALRGIGREARAGNGWNSATHSAMNSDISLDGQIVHDNQAVFEDTVRGFASASVAEEYIGYVSGGYDGGQSQTGVFFGGRIMVNGSTVNSQSRVLIAIWDEYAGQRDESGNVVPAIPVSLSQASGTVTQNQFDIVFRDSHGSVRFRGEFNDDMARGIVSYDNARRVGSNGRGAAGDLGVFEIRTCSLFVCN